jgi:hypothetical protein
MQSGFGLNGQYLIDMEIVIFVGLQASGKTTGLKYIFLTPMALPLQGYFIHLKDFLCITPWFFGHRVMSS